MHCGGPTSWHKGLFYAPIKKPIKKEQTSKSYKIQYFCVFNTSHTVLGDMLNFCQKLVCITTYKARHTILSKISWNTTGYTNSLLMWQLHHFCFKVRRESLRPGWIYRHGKLFTQRPGWNKRIWGKILCVLNKSPATSIQDERVSLEYLPLVITIQMSNLIRVVYMEFHQSQFQSVHEQVRLASSECILYKGQIKVQTYTLLCYYL